jgi:hypothetical protein
MFFVLGGFTYWYATSGEGKPPEKPATESGTVN